MRATRSATFGLSLAVCAAIGLSACGAQVGKSNVAGSNEPRPVPSVPSSWEPSTSQKVIYLTFDDGPGAYTPQVLDVLKENDAKATFFQIGKMIRTRETTEARIPAEGHLIGNHTWDHVNLTTLPPAGVRQQLRMTTKHIGPAQGLCMRPPYGAINDEVRSITVSMGMTPVLWSIDTDDWHHASEAAIQAKIEGATSGSVILMHDGGGDRANTVAALRAALPKLKAAGYRFESVPVCQVAASQ